MKTVIMQLPVPPGGLHPLMGPSLGLIDARKQMSGAFENERATVLVTIDVRAFCKILMNPDEVIDGFVIKEHVVERGISGVG